MIVSPSDPTCPLIHQGKYIRFYNAVDLVNHLEKEKQWDKAGNLSKQLILMDAVILDELGYLSFPEFGRRRFAVSS